MKKILAILALVIPFRAYAWCDASTIVDLKKQASNISISYDYRIVDNKAHFDVTIANITSDIYIGDSNGKIIRYEDTNNGEIVVTDYTTKKIRFQAYAIDEECYDLALATKYINFPIYNYRYEDELCQEMQEYDLCQKWNAPSVSNDEFKQKMESYKEKLKENEKDSTKKEEKSIFSRLGSLFISYYLIVIPIIICIYFYMIYKSKKNEFQ